MKKIGIFVLSQIGLLSLNAQEALQKVDSMELSLPPKVEKDKSTRFRDVLKDTRVSGLGFARFFSIHGANGDGFSQQYRAKIDATTGKIYGISATAGIFFTQGGSAIDLNSATHNTAPNRGYIDNAFGDRFNFSQIYGSKEFLTDTISVNIDLGKMYIASAFTTASTDMGAGGRLNMTQNIGEGKLKYHAAFYDSWSSDHIAYNMGKRNAANTIAMGNNLTMIGISGDKLGGFSFNVAAANVYGLFDTMLFSHLQYDMGFGDSGKLSLLAQAGYAHLSNNASLLISDSAVAARFATELSAAAKHRGVYNIQALLKLGGFDTRFGYLGSFGDGYGISLQYNGGMNVASKLWAGGYTWTYEGLGALGSGSFQDSSINIIYWGANYNFSNIPLKLNLDIAYTFGNTYTPKLNVYNTNAAIKPSSGSITSFEKQQFIVNPKFVEISPSISYSFLKDFELTFFLAGVVGDINFIKTSSELKVSF